MNCIDEELNQIDESIPEDIIIISNGLIGIYCYELSQYNVLISRLTKLRETIVNFNEKELLINDFKKIYHFKENKYKKILKNFEKGLSTLICPNIAYPGLEVDNNAVMDFLNKFWKYDCSLSITENLHKYMVEKIKQKLHGVAEEIYLLNNNPYAYINSQDSYISSNFRLKYNNDMIIYKDVNIQSTELHSYSLFSNSNSKESTKRTILNILAFFHGEPYFTFTENYNFNKKLDDLYEQFDLLDMLRLRQSDFFDCNMEEPIYLESPILKSTKNYNLVIFEESNYEEILDLYHSSLKQFEPLPRCVFLFRVFEYGSSQHYKKIEKPVQYKPEDALNYYISKIMIHHFNPLYYFDSGTYTNYENKEIIKKRNPQFVNLMTKLKKETKLILNEWSVHPYLSKKNGPGDIIYNTGRNLVAHGGNGDRNMKYDYSRNYKHINDVNIILELIARYLIEILNPQFSNIVERRKSFYIKYNNYEKFFEQN